MDRRTIIAILFFLAGLLSLGVAAYLYDSETVTMTAQGASLELGPIVVAPATFATDPAPGSSGIFTIDVTNIGTIDGIFTVSITDITPYLHIAAPVVTGEVKAGQTVKVEVVWDIPLDADLGTGGQDVSMKIKVDLNQKVP